MRTIYKLSVTCKTSVSKFSKNWCYELLIEINFNKKKNLNWIQSGFEATLVDIFGPVCLSKSIIESKIRSTHSKAVELSKTIVRPKLGRVIGVWIAAGQILLQDSPRHNETSEKADVWGWRSSTRSQNHSATYFLARAATSKTTTKAILITRLCYFNKCFPSLSTRHHS